VRAALASAPPCVIAYWHIPVLRSVVDTKRLPMWQLLAGNGGDLVVNGHVHAMSEYVPLDANLAPGHMVQLTAGAGGHKLARAKPDPRMAWSANNTPGILLLTLNGAANGGTATSIGWSFLDTSGTVLRTGSVTC
jgi:hypothetical protein